jgi:hypothetical protein
MSQNGRREFLTSAAAVAAALAACAKQEVAQACGTMYDEHGIVSACAQHFSDPNFLPALATFNVFNIPSPTMADLTQQRVAQTLGTINNIMHVSTVTVKKNDGSLHGPPSNFLPTATDLPLGSYNLIPWNPQSPTQPGSRSPVVLSLRQYMVLTSFPPPPNPFIPDWTKMLMFVVPDPVSPGGPSPGNAMCAHPFGM